METSKLTLSSLWTLMLPLSTVITLSLPSTTEACTTALWSPQATQDGTPMLWKNRDTDTLSNKAIFVASKPLSYVGLVNAEDVDGSQVWAGINQAGLAVMNSASYNVPLDEKESKDREGFIMADILRTCRSAADVEAYFTNKMGSNLGAQSNFGIMDSEGNVILLEVYNHAYHKINVADIPAKYLVNTNFSRSGKNHKGAGYLRFERATTLLQPISREDVTPQLVFKQLSRDFGDAMMLTPTFAQLTQLSTSSPLWSITNYTINRAETAATVVIHGKHPADPSSRAIFWVALGEPLASIAVPLWVEAQSTPRVMHEGKDAQLYLESLRIQKMFRPFEESDKHNYINLTRLANREGTGTYQPIVTAQNAIFEATTAFLKDNPQNSQLAAFQEKMAMLALKALQDIH